MSVIFTVEHNDGGQTIDGVYDTLDKARERLENKWGEVLRHHLPEPYEERLPFTKVPYGESAFPNAKPIYRCCADGWWWGIFEVQVE